MNGIVVWSCEALPKTPDGCLASSSARYALHRLFVEKGWFVKGLQELDPSRARLGAWGAGDFGNWRLEFCRDAKMLVKVE